MSPDQQIDQFVTLASRLRAAGDAAGAAVLDATIARLRAQQADEESAVQCVEQGIAREVAPVTGVSASEPIATAPIAVAAEAEAVNPSGLTDLKLPMRTIDMPDAPTAADTRAAPTPAAVIVRHKHHMGTFRMTRP